MDPQFSIPSEFKDAVRYVDAKDQRTDAEILASLTQHAPITTEKNIWTFWDSGLKSMPSWCQRNIVNWVRLCGPSWSVRVLDSVPGSPTNALTYATADMLPEAFVKGTMDGPYVGPHSADFLRGACLWLHGGVWMDVGILLIRDLDRVCWRQLEDPASPFEVSVPWMYGPVMANHFVASRKGNPFIKRWHDLFVALWRDQINSGQIVANPLIAFGKDVKFEDSQARGFNWEFNVEPTTVVGYIAQVIAWMRVCFLEDPNDGFNGREYYAEKVLLFDALSEDWGAEQTIGFKGEDLFDVLAAKRDADPDSKGYQVAYKTIWRLLTKSTMQKITHGKHLTKNPALGILLDRKENEGMDVAPGTFFELLRYGSIHFEQTREQIDYVKAEKPDIVINRGLLEA
ncbi:putative glycosyl transferase FCK3 [Lachnellula suecica]|uniref:Putative glycosyl transferase FCK3 n=1 Tax=Lachnellula suecica TaxID=602035 RepID=A0A8T9CGK0_9HELO|nr:putative glycosyl transferase FCK3 [Lachnellula suecica]